MSKQYNYGLAWPNGRHSSLFKRNTVFTFEQLNNVRRLVTNKHLITYHLPALTMQTTLA